MELRQAVINFVKTLTNSEKEKMLEMLNHGILCGADYARMSEIEPEIFSADLKRVLEGK